MSAPAEPGGAGRAAIDALRRPLGELPDPLPIPVIERAFDVSVRPPGSKSITNRALLLAALADGTSELRGALVDADDAKVMLRALGRLGAMTSVEVHGDLPTVRVAGVGGRWHLMPGERAELDLHNAGTATRFLAAAAVLAPADSGGVVIDGDARMRERPIEELVEALNHLHDPEPVVEYLGREGYPPIHVHAGRIEWREPSSVRFGRTRSSQFISAMLLVGAFMPGGLLVCIPADDATSRSYIDMTTALLRRVGVVVHVDTPADRAREEELRDRVNLGGGARDRSAYRTLRVLPPPTPRDDRDGARLPAFTLDVEPDASGATYFEAAAALVPGARVTIDGLDLGPRPPLQGDTRFVGVLADLRCTVARGGSLRVEGPARLGPVDADLSDMPDTAMTAAVLACFASPTPENAPATSTLRGLRTLRVKETDRLEALRVELGKIGARVEIFAEGDDEGLRITPPAVMGTGPIVFDTYKDHRMAMALALIGLRRPNVSVRDPGCVAKTYPRFWAELAKLY